MMRFLLLAVLALAALSVGEAQAPQPPVHEPKGLHATGKSSKGSHRVRQVRAEVRERQARRGSEVPVVLQGGVVPVPSRAVLRRPRGAPIDAVATT